MADFGKRVMDFLYVHLTALELLPQDHQQLVATALGRVPANHPCYPNVAKLAATIDDGE